MKGKRFASGSHYFQNTLQLQCWTPVKRRKQSLFKRLLKHYQKELDAVLAASTVGLMFLLGIWGVLVQLAEL